MEIDELWRDLTARRAALERRRLDNAVPQRERTEPGRILKARLTTAPLTAALGQRRQKPSRCQRRSSPVIGRILSPSWIQTPVASHRCDASDRTMTLPVGVRGGSRTTRRNRGIHWRASGLSKYPLREAAGFEPVGRHDRGHHLVPRNGIRYGEDDRLHDARVPGQQPARPGRPEGSRRRPADGRASGRRSRGTRRRRDSRGRPTSSSPSRLRCAVSSGAFQ